MTYYHNMVPPRRFERPTCGLGNRCSIHLSYGGNQRYAVKGRMYRKIEVYRNARDQTSECMGGEKMWVGLA